MHHHAKCSACRSVKPLPRYRNFLIFRMSAAAKFCWNRWNCDRNITIFRFLPARRELGVIAIICAGNSRHRVSVCVCVCLSVCLCVTRRYCIKTAQRRITQTTPRDNPGTLVFWRQNSWGMIPLPLKFALKVTHSFSNSTISTTICSQRLNRESWRKKVN